MTQRTWAGLLAVPLLILLWVVAMIQPLPYVTYRPGLTVDVLDDPNGEETIQVTGAETYRDGGQLRMTTVYVSQPQARVNLFELMSDWISSDAAVYPYQAVYAPGDTPEQNEQEGAIEMVSSQDAAIAVALTELGYDVTPVIQVLDVTEDSPADGRLKVRDNLAEANGADVSTTQDVLDAVEAAPEGEPVEFVVERGGESRSVSVTPAADDDGKPRVGVVVGPGYAFPFKVSVGIDDNIGGPSAGLMFSLGIYDTLTPGSLTDDEIVAGTGTLDEEGKVGPIGGIQQKIAAARDEGAALFLVPAGNCNDAAGAPNGDMRLVRAETMHDALVAIEDWADDPDADLPSCSEAVDAG